MSEDIRPREKLIDKFFDREKVSENDEIIFTFGRKAYTAVSKVLIIAR